MNNILYGISEDGALQCSIEKEEGGGRRWIRVYDASGNEIIPDVKTILFTGDEDFTGKNIRPLYSLTFREDGSIMASATLSTPEPAILNRKADIARNPKAARKRGISQANINRLDALLAPQRRKRNPAP